MAIIIEPIGQQGFELVANRIGEILLEEISNQQVIQGFEETVEVFLERQEPFDKNEDVMISVDYKLADYEGYTTRDSQGECLYHIDLFVSGMGIGDTPPSIIAKNKLYRYLGLIRYILSSSKFLTLGFPTGLIGGKAVKKMIVDNDYSNHATHSNQDGSYIRFARTLFTVRVQENQQLWDSVALQGNNTNISYNETPQGTQLVFNN
jgi:hypothetical protein